MSKIKGDAELEEVLKFEDQYYELGDVVSVVYETYMNKPIVGRLIGLNKQRGYGITLSETITLDTSDKYNSKEETLYVQNIKDIGKI